MTEEVGIVEEVRTKKKEKNKKCNTNAIKKVKAENTAGLLRKKQYRKKRKKDDL